MLSISLESCFHSGQESRCSEHFDRSVILINLKMVISLQCRTIRHSYKISYLYNLIMLIQPIIPSSTFSLIWTFIVIVLLIITAILTPVYVSFIDDNNMAFYYINLVFDVGFGIDVLINFMSAYYDDEQNLVRDFRLIALNYLKAWFWIDVVAMYS